MQRVLEERDWTPPSITPLWVAFEAVVNKIIIEWDVMKMAVEGGWSDGNPYYERAKMIDDALANFCHKATTKSTLEPIEVSNFLIGEMDDRFNAELEMASAAPVATVLVTVFNEVNNNVETGIVQVLGQDICKMIINEGPRFNLLDYIEKVESDSKFTAEQLMQQQADREKQLLEQQQQQQQTQLSAEQQAEEDDGWTTVSTKKRSDRNKR